MSDSAQHQAFRVIKNPAADAYRNYLENTQSDYQTTVKADADAASEQLSDTATSSALRALGLSASQDTSRVAGRRSRTARHRRHFLARLFHRRKG